MPEDFARNQAPCTMSPLHHIHSAGPVLQVSPWRGHFQTEGAQPWMVPSWGVPRLACQHPQGIAIDPQGDLHGDSILRGAESKLKGLQVPGVVYKEAGLPGMDTLQQGQQYVLSPLEMLQPLPLAGHNHPEVAVPVGSTGCHGSSTAVPSLL